MRPSWLWRAWCVLGIVAAVLCATSAQAKTFHRSAYTYEQTFGSALRLVKVDLGLTITEQNAEWGYVLFEYTSRESGARKTRGSFEFVRVRDGVQVWVQLPDMPSYHERVIVDKLARKLGEEHGAPPDRQPDKSKKDERRERDDKARDEEDSPSRDGKADEDRGGKGGEDDSRKR